VEAEGRVGLAGTEGTLGEEAPADMGDTAGEEDTAAMVHIMGAMADIMAAEGAIITGMGGTPAIMGDIMGTMEGIMGSFLDCLSGVF
jgi:hypothetical protein